MKLSKIKNIQEKAKKEAQLEIDRIYKKYSLLIRNEIANELPKDYTLKSCNGACHLYNENDDIIKSGNAFSIHSFGDKQLEYFASLQYCDEFKARIDIPFELKSNK